MSNGTATVVEPPTAPAEPQSVVDEKALLEGVMEDLEVSKVEDSDPAAEPDPDPKSHSVQCQ